MKKGRTLQALGKELERQRNARQDFIADTRSIEMESVPGESVLRLTLNNEPQEFVVGDIAHQQFATRLNIPYRYYQLMQQENPTLLDKNVNTWLHEKPEKRMLRVLDGRVRAFLSARYRRLDNLELCAAILPTINAMRGANIESCEVTERHMYLKVVNKRLKAEVVPGDVVQAGIVISNSEVGLGSLRVEPLIYRLVCKNGLIVKDFAQKKYHVGRQVEESEDTAYEIYSDETLRQDDQAFFSKVKDTVSVALDEAKFQMAVGKMRDAMHVPLEHNPVEEVELLADRFQLTKPECSLVIHQLFMTHDNSRYGLLNAVTAASQLCKDYERATELERIGGEILSLPIPGKLLEASPFPSMRNITPIRREVAIA